jgi:hypothetical protein
MESRSLRLTSGVARSVCLVSAPLLSKRGRCGIQGLGANAVRPATLPGPDPFHAVLPFGCHV